MDKITTEYRGFVITFDEFTESWDCEIAKNNYTRKKLADVKKKIDDFLKAESEFKNMEAITITEGMWSGYAFGDIVTITSVAKDGDVWISWSGKRSKISKSSRDDLCVVNDKNKQSLKDIPILEYEIKNRRTQIAEIKKNMERIFKGD